MAEEGDLEKNVAAPTGGGGNIFDSIGGSIDSLVSAVKSIPSVVKDAAHYTYYTAKPLAAAFLVYSIGGITGLINAGITGGGFVLGKLLGNLKNKEKTTFKQISNEATIGGILGFILGYGFKLAAYTGNLVSAKYGKLAGAATRAGMGLAVIPPFMISDEYLRRGLIKDYKARPWKERKKDITGTTALLGVPIMANWYLAGMIPPVYNQALAAGLSTTYGFIQAKPAKKEEKKAPGVPQLPPGYAMPQAA